MITLNPKTTALMLIDLQNGILGRKLEPIPAEELVERGKALARQFRAEGPMVVLVNAAPVAEEPPRRVDEPSQLPKILPQGFIDLAPGLAEPGDLEITKKTWGDRLSRHQSRRCDAVAIIAASSPVDIPFVMANADRTLADSDPDRPHSRPDDRSLGRRD